VKAFQILVVQDNQDLLELIVKYLELCGWRAAAANSEDNFWEQLGRERPNLILSDVLIQGREAFSLLSAFKRDSRYSDIPVIAITGLSSMRDKNRCIAAGCDKVLAKPFHLDELLRLVECFAKRYKDNHEITGITRKNRGPNGSRCRVAARVAGRLADGGAKMNDDVDIRQPAKSTNIVLQPAGVSKRPAAPRREPPNRPKKPPIDEPPLRVPNRSDPEDPAPAGDPPPKRPPSKLMKPSNAVDEIIRAFSFGTCKYSRAAS
jgi:CheY-like chemotaxis protein